MASDLLIHGMHAHAACVLAANFIRSYAPQVETATAVADDCSEADGVHPQTIRAYYSRTFAWMESIKKLGEARDIQAVTVAARALFEGQVDLALLHHAPLDHSAQKVFDWERSALLKQQEKIDRFFDGKTLPDEYRATAGFLAGSEIAQIKAARDRWWGGRHPSSGRWTGRNLEQDAKLADGLFPDAKLAEFYELEYAPTCWGSHGSGFAGLRGKTDDLVVVSCAHHLWHARRFALLNTRLVLEDIGVFIKVVFDDFDHETQSVLAELRADEDPGGPA